MTIQGFDTWGMGPSAADAKAAGIQFRTWYSSYDSSKDGPVDGPALYAAEGIWSVCNFETTIDRVLTGGADGGAQDMMHAINEFGPRGMPAGAVVILSADEAIPASQFPQAAAYYEGARKAAAGQYLTGCYGEQALISYLKGYGAIEIGWRTMSTAWPGGASTAFCDLIQTGGSTIAGVSVDLDEALVPFFGQWMPGKLYSAQEDFVVTPQDLEAIAQWIENRKLGEIDMDGNQTGTTITLGVAVARSRAVETQLLAAIKALGAPQVDANALAAALVGNSDFVSRLAAAIIGQIGTDLKTGVQAIGPAASSVPPAPLG